MKNGSEVKRCCTFYGLTSEQILELRAFWLKHHNYLPKEKEIKLKEIDIRFAWKAAYDYADRRYVTLESLLKELGF